MQDSMIWSKKSSLLSKQHKINSDLHRLTYMKKFFALVALLVYVLGISSLVHASTMGFFHSENSHQSMGHCHEKSTPDSKPNMDCCELVVSNNYSQSQIKFTTVSKIISFVADPASMSTIVVDRPIIQYYSALVAPPWWNPNIKFHKFSDLMGIIVDLA